MPDNGDTTDFPKINVTFSLTNLFKFFSYITPFLLTFFMIMFSILTGKLVNGLLFIAGLVIFTFFIYLLKNSLKSEQHTLASPMCNLMPTPFTLKREGKYYNSPALSPAIIAFVMGYLIYPMILNPENLNPGLIVLLVVLLGINSGVEIHAKCIDISGILLGIFVGLLFSIIYVTLFMISGNNKLLFFTETSNNGVQCSKPGRTQFRCVKKHGSSLRDISEETIDYGSSSASGILTPFQQKAKDNFMYISSDTYTQGTSLAEESKIPIGLKCPSSKDDMKGGTICDLGGYCSNNKCVACRTVKDCYKRGYGSFGHGGGPVFNSWNKNALKCGVFNNSRMGKVKIYKCIMSKDTTLIDTKKDWYRQPGQGAEPYKYPANYQVKQCVPNTIAISEYGRNRGSDSEEELSVDGILYIQKKNIANEENGLRLTNNELDEILVFIILANKKTTRAAWKGEAIRDVKKLLKGLKNIPFYSNKLITHYNIIDMGDEEISTIIDSIGQADAQMLINNFKDNSYFVNDDIYVIPWDIPNLGVVIE